MVTAVKHVLFILSLIFVSRLASAYDNYSVEEAYEQSSNGEIVLVDIRNDFEREMFGTMATSVLLPVNDPQFGSKLLKLKEGNPDKTVALICATGGRSKNLNDQLKKLNISGFADVPEGQRGWKKKGLPE